ncbi:hypothetical protein HW132_14830 [Brasilonema sp. CT11]|nr:hypothetical protein [Brasilonema sp. CT11]
MKYIFQPHPQPLSLLRRGERLRQQMRGEVTTILHRSENRYSLRPNLPGNCYGVDFYRIALE